MTNTRGMRQEGTSMANIGNYKIIKEISEGGFGRIFQAEHLYLPKKYACLKQNKNDSPDHVELLKLEAMLLWELNEHHSIPHTKDFFKVSTNNYVMVMDYIQGQTIGEMVSTHSRLHPEEACWITERLLGALYYCHYNGVIHSDVKPENVFIEQKKHDIKLIDFGLAAYLPTSRTMPSGYTERYAAPELIAGKPPVPETDLYGAGIVLLYALGGDVSAKRLPPDTPPELIHYCNTLLRYDPAERPNWEKSNPLEALSNLRLKVFGRRHMSS
ncbi:MAG: serine/threonine-protein kinase [Nanoarchaeota archaeon]